MNTSRGNREEKTQGSSKIIVDSSSSTDILFWLGLFVWVYCRVVVTGRFMSNRGVKQFRTRCSKRRSRVFTPGSFNFDLGEHKGRYYGYPWLSRPSYYNGREYEKQTKSQIYYYVCHRVSLTC